jgi:hypothetical protein
VRLELQRAEDLLEFSVQRARMRIDDARDLHRQRRAAGNRLAIPDHLTNRTHQRQRIDARMLPEPAILIVQQRIDV